MIEINNLTFTTIEEGILKKVAERVLEGENKKNTDLSIVLVGQGRIRTLNKKYLGKNWVTDVLAFSGNGLPRNTTSSALRAKTSKTLEVDIRGLGEIVICLREVKKNAERFSSAFEKELARVLIHGILHLLGYDHEKPEFKELRSSRASAKDSAKEAKKMAEKENYYLNLIFK